MKEIKKAQELLNLLMERVNFWVEDDETKTLFKEMYIKEINKGLYSRKK